MKIQIEIETEVVSSRSGPLMVRWILAVDGDFVAGGHEANDSDAVHSAKRKLKEWADEETYDGGSTRRWNPDGSRHH